MNEAYPFYAKGPLVIDIDGTLCPIKLSGANYAHLQPNSAVVARLKEMKAAGFGIVLFTARNMRTYRGSLGQINRHTAPALIKWLDDWEIPYDEIYYGKPWPGHDGFYVDDRTIRPSEFVSRSVDDINSIFLAEQQPHHLDGFWASKPLTIVITMAGLGSRFLDAGYDNPKYEIEVRGKTLFEWSMNSLKAFLGTNTRVVFVALEANRCSAFVRQKCETMGIKDFVVVELPALTDGQATTAMAAQPYWRPDAPLLIYNIDTLTNPEAVDPGQIPSNAQGWVPCFRAKGDHWSFARVAADTGWATEFAEKRRISDLATTGLYWFSSALGYAMAYQLCYPGDRMDNSGERYIAPMYQSLADASGQIAVTVLSLNDVVGLGKPNEVEAFSAGEVPDFVERMTDSK